jgi:hypothetical protein
MLGNARQMSFHCQASAISIGIAAGQQLALSP